MGSGGGASAARQALIWLSSDDDDDGANDAVQLVEASAAKRPPGDKPPAGEEDSDILVTFCRNADVLPHARHDCPAHAFLRTERETAQPVRSNADSCPKCFCYVCDKPVTECLSWTTPTQCHCNAHSRSQYWKAERNQELCGILTTFHLEPSEIDVHLRRGGQRLQGFIPELSAAYSHYLCGTPPSDQLQCTSQPPLSKRQCPEAPEHRYSEVFRVASLFIDEAKKEHPKASAVMLLGVLRELSMHNDPSKTSPKPESLECLKVAVPVLMDRVTLLCPDFHLWSCPHPYRAYCSEYHPHPCTHCGKHRLLVVGGLSLPLCEKLTRFFYSVSLPPHCSRFFTSLNIMPWDHRVLTTILRGQNVAGPQKQRGRGSTLNEHFPVIRARVDWLESTGRYRELVRYLRAVTSSERIRLQDLHDKVPFYLCKTGDFVGAVEALLAPTSQACCPACRLTPSNFQYYLKMLWTSSVPTGNQLQGEDQWVFKRGSLVKPYMLVKQALRMLYRNPTLYQDIQSWGFLLALWGSSSAMGPNGLTRQALQVPPPSFQMMVLTAGDTILRDLSSQVTPVLPAHLFNSSLCREACLILCIQATVQMLLAQLPQLPPLLSLILDLGENLWALELLLESIQHRAPGMVDMVRQELSDQQCVLLEAWQALGPKYVGELLCLLLGSRVPELQALGVALIHLVARNLNRCPWAKLLDLQRLRTFKSPHLGMAEHLQLSQILAIMESTNKLAAPESGDPTEEWDEARFQKEVESLKYQLAFKREMSSKSIPELLKWIEDGIPKDPFLNPDLMKNNPWVEKGKCSIL